MAIFTDLLNQGRTNLAMPGFVHGRDWYRERARATQNINVSRLINGNQDHIKANVMPGHMYIFNYDPKHKETLPFYDRYPIVFPIKIEADSFLGLNLHYLPHLYRAKLMDALYDLTTDKKFDEKTRLRLSYNLLNSATKYKYFEPCVKRYLKSHVRSRFLNIPSNEWDIALFLPLERFTVSKSKVYQDSINKIRNDTWHSI